MPELNDDQPHVTFDCMLPTDGNCKTAVKNNDADLAILDSLDTYKAYNNDGLIAIAAEDEGQGNVEYYAVAVVKKDFCADANVTLKSLQGKNACFTGYQRTAGWVVPVGVMLNENVMPYVATNANVQNDAESVASFFDKVCAPRVANNGPTITAVWMVLSSTHCVQVCSSTHHQPRAPTEWHGCQMG